METESSDGMMGKCTRANSKEDKCTGTGLCTIQTNKWSKEFGIGVKTYKWKTSLKMLADN